MFEELHKLASDGKCSLIMTIAAKGENLVVRIAPIPSEKDAPAALSQKLELEGTPAELDTGMLGILSSYATTRKSLQEALADASTVMQAATKEANQQTVAAIAKGNGKTATPPLPPPPVEQEKTNVAAKDDKTIELF